MTTLDPNWQSDALDPTLGFFEETLAIRGGYHRTDEGEHGEAIFTTSSYVYKSAKDAADHFDGTKKGNVYSRHTNPTVRAFERRLALLEGGERCVATASGMGAILTMCLAYLKAGDHLLCAKQLFGSSVALFDTYFRSFGVEVSYVDCFDNDAWQNAIQDNTKILYCESPSNPLAQIADLRFLANLAHDNGAMLIVDNCFATPAIQKPLELGADVVIHSASKYIDGQGRVLGGALVGSNELMEKAFTVIRTGGISLSPFNAWVLLKGLETLSIRMKAHCDNANRVAEFLSSHPNVQKVHFSGLPTHPSHELAKSQYTHLDVQGGAFGAIIGFEVADKDKAWHVIDSTQVISITNNLGDAKSTITHPASTTHFRMTPEQRVEAGVNDGLIRLSVGLENVNDIINDLKRGLDEL
ncbi:O-succinylhomoserine sulfhydrylase [Moraxella bovis]|uniref:O-succinylhomoserine sulfhydrylase n=1 Tax=Moraxella bovis TaxID=476 RepID=UPI00222751F6|nr:O-succinylhomoserine sulfhydrylase [Moraxella bovis]UYZ69197.1 O-succinylhomoserine sulfhydrylase [Moraxella bovis]UZA26773.1 O-succinylhomoserine sulfhydrylase [Moraxella bovis]UZA38695.1 O-succinylhomoserine sulfhydrylase [Moraxella bovis]WAJ72955.1 O-succinylhomoserine sulfhydrylase [Moraxella bovis]